MYIDHIDRYENYGPTHGICGYFSGEIKVLSTMEPRNIQSVLTRETIFPRPQSHIKSVAPFLSKGVFTVHGEAWKNVRDLLRPQFTTRKLQDLVIFAKHVDIMFEAMPTIGDDGWTEEFSFLELLHFFTLDTTTELLFGTSVNSQRAAMGERCRCLDTGTSITLDNRLSPTNVAKAFDCANEWASLRMRLGSAYWLCDSLQFRRACKTVHDFTDKVRLPLIFDIKVNIYPLVCQSSTKNVCRISCCRFFCTTVK
jgi:cytochrome P450